jgi:dTMP kinase
MSKGLFITFEGIDGSGKSTQAKLLAKSLEDSGRNVILTREPGGSSGAELIRKLLVEGPPNRWSAETELLLFTAARRDHIEKTINPSLAAGKIVISDRYADSTRVYQGVTRGELRSSVDKLHELMIVKEPDLTFIIDMDPSVALKRGLSRNSGEDRFEDFGLSFQYKLREGFIKLQKDFNSRCIVLDGSEKINSLSAKIYKLVQKKLDD